jgi:Dyp-type peroxidase family
MANPFADRADVAVALHAFIAGLMGLDSAEARPTPGGERSYRTVPDSGALEILYPLRALNGSAAFRRPPDHHLSVRLNVRTSDTARVKAGLAELTTRVRAFIGGLDRQRHSSRSAVDEHGQQNGAFIGFGPTFFRDRASGASRWSGIVEPKQLTFLELRGDAEQGLDPRRSQADLIVMLESSSYTLLVDGYDHLLHHVAGADWLELVDVHQGATRGDARNHLGFYDGVRNPSLVSNPSASAVALVEPPDEPPVLRSGSYVVFRKYSLDLGAWSALPVGEQEARIGQRRATGQDVAPLPPGSHVANASATGAPPILRRGIGYLEVSQSGEADSGLLFIAFQAKPAEFVRLHDTFLIAPPSGAADRLLAGGVARPLTSDLYFVPDYIGWGYVGQQLFEPERFERLFEAGHITEDGRFEEAMAIYRDLGRAYPDFLPTFSNMSDLAPDLDAFIDADRTADEALGIDANEYLALGGKAWAKYLTGEYEAATNYARQAIESTPEDLMRAFPYHTLGASLVELGRPGDAEVALRRAAERVNVEPLICYSLGNSLDAQRRDAEAAKIYARTLEVVEFRLRNGQVTTRDRRSLFNMRFIRYQSPRNQQTLATVRRLLS